MGVVKRIWINLTRNKGRVLLLLGLMIILTALTSFSLIALRATERNIQNLHYRMPRVVVLQPTWSGNFENGFGEMTSEVIYYIANQPEIAFFDYSNGSTWYSRTLERYLITDRYERFTEALLVGPLLDFDSLRMHRGDMGAGIASGLELFFTQGVQQPYFFDLMSGVVEISQGRNFTMDEIEKNTPVTIISTSFAQENGLIVGDFIQLESIIFDTPTGFFLHEDLQVLNTPPTSDDLLGNAHVHKTFTFEIIGMFDILEQMNASNDWQSFLWTNGMLNTLYIPNGFAWQVQQFLFENREHLPFFEYLGFDKQMRFFNEMLFPHEVFYLLSDGVDPGAFTTKINSELPDGLLLLDLSASFDGFLAGFERINSFVTHFLVVSVGAIIIILGLSVILFLHDRHHEIAIYQALGESQLKLIVQFVSEMISIALVGGIIGIFVGYMMTRHVSTEMLRIDLISHQENMGNTFEYGFIPASLAMHNQTVDQLLENYETLVRLEDLGLFLILNVVIVFVASMIPIFLVIKLTLHQTFRKGNIG